MGCIDDDCVTLPGKYKKALYAYGLHHSITLTSVSTYCPSAFPFFYRPSSAPFTGDSCCRGKQPACLCCSTILAQWHHV